jgi:hypothetical protein
MVVKCTKYPPNPPSCGSFVKCEKLGNKYGLFISRKKKSKVKVK